MRDCNYPTPARSEGDCIDMHIWLWGGYGVDEQLDDGSLLLLGRLFDLGQFGLHLGFCILFQLLVGAGKLALVLGQFPRLLGFVRLDFRLRIRLGGLQLLCTVYTDRDAVAVVD